MSNLGLSFDAMRRVLKGMSVDGYRLSYSDTCGDNSEDHAILILNEGGNMSVESAAQLKASKTLKKFWDHDFPVDPIAIAKHLNIEVKSTRFRDPETSGAIIAKGPDDITIYFAKEDSFPRQQFTVAHELGHYFDRVLAEDSDYSFVETRHPGSYDLHEFFADEFAGNLLMPTNAIVPMWATQSSVEDLARYFAVSTPAVRKRLARLRKLGQIS